MNGFRFYADLTGTNPALPLRTPVRQLRLLGEAGQHVNCVALLIGDEHRNHDGTQEALAGTFSHPNSDVSLGSVRHDYLRRCRRIPESIARKLHPRLFARLDAEKD